MLFSVGVFLACLIFLYFINYLQLKYEFCLDKILDYETHKYLLNLNHKVPLSGSFYFIFIFFLLFFFEDKILFFICLLFFLIGLLSDLKIITSPKLRLLFQFLLLFIFLQINSHIQIDTRIDILNELINNKYLRLFFISFFILVFINGSNFIDGVNCLSSLNFLIILFFLYLLSEDIEAFQINELVHLLIISIIVFILFNFFGKSFLGDGGVYGLSFLLAIIIIELSMLNEKISPYFIANLLLYPAFENLFSIVRRVSINKKNYLADNSHLHQLLFMYLNSKKIIKQKFLLSSFTGIIINFYLLIIYFIGYLNYSDTEHQIYLVFLNIFSYLTIYSFLKKKLND